MSLKIHFQVEFLNDRIIHICFTFFIQEPDNIYHSPSQFLSHLIISLWTAINGCFSDLSLSDFVYYSGVTYISCLIWTVLFTIILKQDLAWHPLERIDSSNEDFCSIGIILEKITYIFPRKKSSIFLVCFVLCSSFSF